MRYLLRVGTSGGIFTGKDVSDQRQEFLRLRNEGVSRRDAARQAGVNKRTAQDWDKAIRQFYAEPVAITVITVGIAPTGVAVSPDGSATNTVTDTITVELDPTGVAISPDGATAYVSNQGSDSVSVIDTATNTVIDTITVGADPPGVAVSPDGMTAYVTHNGSSTVSVIDTTTNTVIDTIAVGANPFGVAVSPDSLVV